MQLSNVYMIVSCQTNSGRIYLLKQTDHFFRSRVSTVSRAMVCALHRYQISAVEELFTDDAGAYQKGLNVWNPYSRAVAIN